MNNKYAMIQESILLYVLNQMGRNVASMVRRKPRQPLAKPWDSAETRQKNIALHSADVIK